MLAATGYPEPVLKLRDLLNTWIDTMAIFYRLNILRYYDRRVPR